MIRQSTSEIKCSVELKDSHILDVNEQVLYTYPTCKRTEEILKHKFLFYLCLLTYLRKRTNQPRKVLNYF